MFSSVEQYRERESFHHAVPITSHNNDYPDNAMPEEGEEVKMPDNRKNEQIKLLCR